MCAAAEVEHVAVVEFPVDSDGQWRHARAVPGDLFEDGFLPVGELWGGHGCFAAQDRRAGVVDVAVGQQQPPQVRRIVSEPGRLASMCVRPSGSRQR